MQKREFHSHEWWMTRINDWHSSGLTAREYCTKYSLSYSALRSHIRTENTKAKAEVVEIVPVVVNNHPSVSNVVINGVPIKTDVDTLRKILGIQV